MLVRIVGLSSKVLVYPKPLAHGDLNWLVQVFSILAIPTLWAETLYLKTQSFLPRRMQFIISKIQPGFQLTQPILLVGNLI